MDPVLLNALVALFVTILASSWKFMANRHAEDDAVMVRNTASGGYRPPNIRTHQDIIAEAGDDLAQANRNGRFYGTCAHCGRLDCAHACHNDVTPEDIETLTRAGLDPSALIDRMMKQQSRDAISALSVPPSDAVLQEHRSMGGYVDGNGAYVDKWGSITFPKEKPTDPMLETCRHGLPLHAGECYRCPLCESQRAGRWPAEAKAEAEHEALMRGLV